MNDFYEKIIATLPSRTRNALLVDNLVTYESLANIKIHDLEVIPNMGHGGISLIAEAVIKYQEENNLPINKNFKEFLNRYKFLELTRTKFSIEERNKIKDDLAQGIIPEAVALSVEFYKDLCTKPKVFISVYTAALGEAASRLLMVDCRSCIHFNRDEGRHKHECLSKVKCIDGELFENDLELIQLFKGE